MKKKHNLTKAQLEEIKELAKMKALKDLASHFNMSASTFRWIRKQQPEIDKIYQEVIKERDNKIYSLDDILEIEKMYKTLDSSSVARALGISIPTLTKAREKQPELESAIIRGINNRPSNFNYLTRNLKKLKKEENEMIKEQKEERVEQDSFQVVVKKNNKKKELNPETTESLFTRAPDDISQEEAIIRFRRLKEEDKKHRQLQELKRMNSRLN
jgi:hypothetical protein